MRLSLNKFGGSAGPRAAWVSALVFGLFLLKGLAWLVGLGLAAWSVR